jgi:PAS domain S-box-containing protein
MAAVHIRALYAFPIALHFLLLVLVATLGGLGPALVALLASFTARLLQAHFYPHPPLRPGEDFFRFCIFILVAVFISLVGRRRRISEARLEIALSELNERTDALIESLRSGKCATWSLDLDSDDRTRWYKGSYPIFGRPFSELEELPSLTPLLHPEDQLQMPALIAQMKTYSEPVVAELRVPWPNGELHWLEMRATRVPGKACFWRGVTLDITERKLAEAALIRSEKLAAMGRLASTVAHEINNPLEAVMNLLYLTSSDETLDPTTRSYVSMAERELARLGNITRLTLGFVRSNSETVDVDVAESVEDVLSILQHRFEASEVKIERHYQPDVRISIPPHELRQIATNLIANASDAVSGQGPAATVSIRIERHGDRAVLLVEDNGSGIAAANLQRIFDPFFSTKKEVGTGIGLWVTKEIVEKNGGHISAESGDLPSGFHTSFRVDFPLASATPVA